MRGVAKAPPPPINHVAIRWLQRHPLPTDGEELPWLPTGPATALNAPYLPARNYDRYAAVSPPG